MIDRIIKTIIALLLCVGIATAQQAPDAIKSRAKNKIEHQTMIKKWQEKLKQYNTPESRKSQEYVKLRQEMRKELQDIRHGKTTDQVQMTPMQNEKINETYNFTRQTIKENKPTSQSKVHDQSIAIPDSLFSKKSNKTFQLAGKGINVNPSTQSAQPSLPAVPVKVIEATTCYDVPFPKGTGASKGNEIELSVANSSTLSVEGVKVELTNAPVWLKFKSKEITLEKLESKKEQAAMFNFSVEKTAEVNKEQTLSFTITDNSGQVWKKEIKLRVTPPENYELYQNYPNPFNPTTTIEYQIPPSPFSEKGERGGFVSLKVYDLLGREVATLVHEQQEAGYHQATLNAQRLASGVYIYQLTTTDEKNNQHIFRKKMLLLR